MIATCSWDVCGPIHIELIGGGGDKYFLLLVDNYTRMTWIYFLSMEEVFECFLKFPALVNRESWKKSRSCDLIEVGNSFHESSMRADNPV